MYFDTAYIAKFYFNEPESPRVRELARRADAIHSSIWALAEFHGVLHRRLREGGISLGHTRNVASAFLTHAEGGLWILHPLTEGLLRRMSTRMLTVPAQVFLRTGDAVHLTTASEIGEHEVWTNDRHMLAAAEYFGLSGRSV